MSRENSYATLDADGQVPLDQLDNAAGGGPHNHAGEDITSGTVADARVASTLARDAEVATAVSDHAAAANPHPTYLTAAEGDAAYEATGGIATHSADTTAIHGIADTAALSLTSHDHDADYEATGAVAAHEADTSVHGIADTTVLATDAEVATAVSDHAAAANPHAVYLTAAEGDAAYEVTGAVATHAGLADPHVGYRLESADHSHATTGLQAGTVAHTALTSVGTDDHHARDHAINGATHTGTLDDAQIPAAIARDAEVTTAIATHAATPHNVVKNLGADFVSAASPVTTMAKATNLDQALSIGTWVFEYHCMWQTSATATAIKLGVMFGGTATRFVVEATGFEATTAASTGVETAIHAAFGLRAGGQNSAPSATTVIFGPTATATTNADYYTVIRGIIVVTVAGDLQLYFGSEATGSTQTLELPTSLIATKIA